MVELIGRYRVLARSTDAEARELIRAVDQVTGAQVALRTERVASGAEEEYRRSYGRLAPLLVHPHVVRVHEVFRRQDGLCRVEEWVDGAALEELPVVPLDARPAVALLLAVLDGLAHAHDRGVIHGDLRPATIMLTAAGVPKVTDFGRPRLLAEDGGPGPDRFTSPEVVAGRVLIPASDVYSAAVLLLELTTRRGREGSSRVPGLTPVIGTVLAAALEPVVEHRYPDAGVFRRALLSASEESFGPGWASRVDLAPLCGSRNTQGPSSPQGLERDGAHRLWRRRSA